MTGRPSIPDWGAMRLEVLAKHGHTVEGRREARKLAKLKSQHEDMCSLMGWDVTTMEPPVKDKVDAVAAP